MIITVIAGARPNFMKIAPILEAIESKKKKGFDIDYHLVHTGQHYDEKMSKTFFRELGIPDPDINLASGGGTQAEQTASIMIRFESYLLQHKSDLVLVVGDVTSTMACAIVAQKLGIKVAHVEGGIRSGDWSMPEEINRLVTDSITNYFFTTSEIANQNLLQTGVSNQNIFFVGNTMIDTLLKNQSNFKRPVLFNDYGLEIAKYLVLTLHRPSNVDDPVHLKSILLEIIDSSVDYKILFPIHPRTQKSIDESNFKHERLLCVDPLGYLEFNYLVMHAKAVITDSGGITEETTVMGIPCITLRDSTERPETCSIGTNELIGTDPSAINPALQKLFKGQWKKGKIPEKWDGKAGERIVESLINIFNI